MLSTFIFTPSDLSHLSLRQLCLQLVENVHLYKNRLTDVDLLLVFNSFKSTETETAAFIACNLMQEADVCTAAAWQRCWFLWHITQKRNVTLALLEMKGTLTSVLNFNASNNKGSPDKQGGIFNCKLEQKRRSSAFVDMWKRTLVLICSFERWVKRLK